MQNIYATTEHFLIHHSTVIYLLISVYYVIHAERQLDILLSLFVGLFLQCNNVVHNCSKKNSLHNCNLHT